MDRYVVGVIVKVRMDPEGTIVSHGVVYERYRQMGIRRLRTDESGALTLRFGAQLEVEEYRPGHARYWYGR